MEQLDPKQALAASMADQDFQRESHNAGGRVGYATDGAVQPMAFLEDAKGTRYDTAGNIIPPQEEAITNALTTARAEVPDPYAEEIASGKRLLADQAYQNQSWGDWAKDVGSNLYNTGMAFLPTALGGEGQVGLSDIAKGAYESAKSGVTLPGDVLSGETKVFDPASGDLTDEVLRRGADFTGIATVGPSLIPYEPNTLRMGAKGIPETPAAPEEAALKAAQEASGGDDAAAAARAAQLDDLNPVPPPQGVTTPEHSLGTQRGIRTVISPTSIKLTPAEKAVVDSFKSRADRAMVASRIRETKARYPKSDGWSPFEAVGAEIDEKGNPVIKWQEQKYGFNTAMQPGMTTQVDPVTGEKIKVPVVEERSLRPNTPEYERAANRATRNGVKAVEDIVRRAAEGDEVALRIIRQAGWYREFMRKGFDERGGSYPAFSDLLGATSPNTAVDQNYRYAVDIQNRFARGDFDKPVKFASEYTGSLNAFPEEKLIFRDPVGPKGPQKLQYGMNSRNAQMALADKWRQKEPGQAPKARNFSGNLGGATDEATIDVWAARFINRMAGRKRLPPPVESGVKGKLGSNLAPTGEFGYGQDVFRRITDELNRKGNLLPYLRELGYDNLTPMDMQALTWFIEKEHWTKNNWTTAAGEGGSFEDELLRYPSERWQSGVSIQQADAPTDTAMAYTRNVFENSLRDDPDVNQFRVHPTIGRYAGNNERSFDLELTAKPGWNPRTWMAAVIREAQANNQYDVFFSKRLSPEQAAKNPNARPGVEVYFRDRKTLDQALPILEEFTKRNADGFTFVTDLRLREREMGGKEAPDFVGVRMQWVPEIRSRWDEDFRAAVEADPNVLNTEKIAALNAMQDALDALDKAGLGVVDARVHNYDTLTVGKESYDKFLEGITDPDNAAGRYEGSSGAAVDPVRRFGQPLYSHVEGRNRALRAGDEGRQPDTGGDVVGAGQPTGALTPEERSASFQKAFGQTVLKDPQGKPMRLYHLTPKDITEFSAGEGNRSGPVVFLSPYADYQPAYHQAGRRNERGDLTSDLVEGANVMPVYADVRNPLVLDHPRKVREAAAKYQGGDRNFPRIVTPEAKAAMEADGFDAIIFGGDNALPYGDRPQDARLGFQENKDEEFIIFDPKRIKSATGNRGTYDFGDADITKAFGGALHDDEDIDNALRLARATGGRAAYAEAGSVPVMMEDAKGNKYDAQGNVIPPQAPGPQPARSEMTPDEIAQRGVNDPATYDALMERYAIPDRDIAEYEAMKAKVASQPQDVRQMTHIGDRPTREMTVNMPLFGGEYSMGRAPYDVAGGMEGIAQGAYDFKTMPAYFFPPTAPFALGADVLESRMADDPAGFVLNAVLTPQGASAAKSGYNALKRNSKVAAGLAGLGAYFTPDDAEAGPERWFSKLFRAAEALPMEKMTGEQALAMLRKSAPPEEIRWTGVEGFASQNPVTTKQALLDFIKRNQVQTQDVVLGGGAKPTRREDVVPDEEIMAKYRDGIDRASRAAEQARLNAENAEKSGATDVARSFRSAEMNARSALGLLRNAAVNEQIKKIGGLGEPVRYGPGSSYGEKYATPGGKDYRETLITLPVNDTYTPFVKSMRDEARDLMYKKAIERGVPDQEAVSMTEDVLNSMKDVDVARYTNKSKEFRAVYDEMKARDRSVYKSPHWKQDNVLSHIRSQILEANPPGANRPLRLFNVDENQSDLAQAGRKEGFRNQDAIAKVAKLREELNQNLDVSNKMAEKLKQEHYARIRPIQAEREAAVKELDESYRRGEVTAMQRLDRLNEIYEKSDVKLEPLIEQYKRDLIEKIKPIDDLTRNLSSQIDEIGSKIGTVPEAPYVTSTQGWTDLSIKKALDQAIDSGADYFTFTPGEVQAERYNLSNHIGGVKYNPYYGTFSATDPSGERIISQTLSPDEDEHFKELEGYVGRGLAEKLTQMAKEKRKKFKSDFTITHEPNGEYAIRKNGALGWGAYPTKAKAEGELDDLFALNMVNDPVSLDGLDLKVGGEGMVDYYNNIYKKRVEKVVKDLTGKKVQWEILPAETSEGIVPRLGFRIDDDLRNAKFPTFASGGVVNKALKLTADI